MTEDFFVTLQENLAGEGEIVAFNLAMVAEALEIVSDLHEQNVGGETVEKRFGEFKSWDPEVFKVDKDTENAYRRRLEEQGKPYVLLSEEVGRLEINVGNEGDLTYAVSDPFDGSYLLKRGIPSFWYSSLAFYDAKFEPLSCVVGDAVFKKVAFASSRGAFAADLSGEGIMHRFKLDRDYRERMGRKDVTQLEDASIESYAMKPKKFLKPLVARYGALLEQFKFLLPNGGPNGFVDVAEGKIDVYLAWQQPYVDVFSGIQVAQMAGAVVTDFGGRQVKCHDNIETLHDVVACTNQALHEKVLDIIERIGGK